MKQTLSILLLIAMLLTASCGKEAVKKGAHAGNLLKKLSAICGGGGGGRPDSAMSGGKLPEKVDEALAAAESVLLEMLK
jgi:alanyl-tRNA synthetase